MNKKTIVIGAIALLIALVLLTPLYFYLSQGKKTAGEFQGVKEQVRLGYVHQILSCLIIVAIEKGFFNREGLVVTAEKYPTGSIALKNMFKGDIDVATVAEVPIVFNSFERRDFSIIASIAFAHDNQMLLARKDAGIARPADLKGKRIATYKGSGPHFFLHLFLVKHGLSEKDIRLSFYPPEELPDALSRREIDGFTMGVDLLVDKTRVLLGENVTVFSEPGLYSQPWCLVASNNFIKEKPEAVRRLLKALLRAEGYVKDNPEETIKLLTAKLTIIRPVAEAILPKSKEIAMRVALDQILLSTLEEQASWAIKKELVKGKAVPNYLNFIHIEALKAVRPEAMTIIH